MKSKYLLLTGIVMIGIGFTSCRKVYTCSCTANDVTTVTTFNFEHKGNVKNFCDQLEKAAQLEDPGATCRVEEAENQQP